MLPLTGPRFPESVEELAVALHAGLAGIDISPRELAISGEWPRVKNLSIDLTGARISRTTPMPKKSAKTRTTIFVENLALSAAPVFFEDAPVHVRLHANETECRVAGDSPDESSLHLLNTKNGSVMIEAQRADLETALKKFAHTFLAKQGAELKSAQLELLERSPRVLAFRAEITAKAFVMTARVEVTGQLEIDEQLNLRVRELATTGHGVIATLATGFLRPRFAEIEKRSIPLAAYPFAGVALRDVRISGGNALRIDAQFGA